VFEFHDTVSRCEKGIVGTASHVDTGMDMGPSLTNDYVTGEASLTVCSFYSESLGFGISAVLGGTDAFFMSKKLYT